MDIQAAIKVIGRRSERQRQTEQNETEVRGSWVLKRLNLSRSHLARGDFLGLHFENADFTGSCLERAWLPEAHMQNARLNDVHLEGAVLAFANIEEAQFARAHLHGAVFDGANARGTALGEVNALTQEQIDGLVGDDKTIIPEKFERPSRWSRNDAVDAT